jgi:hypothetical protein
MYEHPTERAAKAREYLEQQLERRPVPAARPVSRLTPAKVVSHNRYRLAPYASVDPAKAAPDGGPVQLAAICPNALAGR